MIGSIKGLAYLCCNQYSSLRTNDRIDHKISLLNTIGVITLIKLQILVELYCSKFFEDCEKTKTIF